MAILAGFHVEGYDYLIFHALLAKLLDLPECEIQPDWIDRPGRGWQFVLDEIPKALKRFYNQCAQLAVVGVDNDGNEDLTHTGQAEDARHPRHWNHAPDSSVLCRWCVLNALIARTRVELNWLPRKPGGQWPIILAVPVEMIESWLLIAQAIVTPGAGDLAAESTARFPQKQKLYSQPVSSKDSVERVALPLIRAMTSQQIGMLAAHSRSFTNFRDQITAQQAMVLGSRDCWAEGDRGGER